MAKAIATVSGVALKPGVSRNRRLYTREAIAAAVGRAQGQLADGGMALTTLEPLTTKTHHAADDDSTRIVGAIRSLTLAEDGSARFTADIADTEHGRTIASLLDTSDGRPPFLRGVSIRGAWDGKVRKERGPDGDPVERGDSLTLLGIDYTSSPGVPGAQVDTFAWVTDGGTETTERVPITESVEEARVTITEDSPPDGVREALRSLFGEAITGGNTPSVSKRDSGLADDAGRKYADPGYQPDKKQRYDISTKAKAKAAYSYVSQAANAKLYTGPQLKRIKGRIKSALKGFGVTVAAEGWTIEPALLITEAIAEYAGMDPECAGSYSLSATNGPTTVTVCSYGLDPADLQLILAQACKGAGMALCALDPDMDADVDVPGAEAEDDDGDASQMDNGDGVEDLVARLRAAIKRESAEDPHALLAEAMSAAAVTEAAPEDPAPEEPAAANQGTEAPMQETTTTEAAATAPAATFTQADLDAAAARAVALAEKSRKDRKAAKRAAAGAPAETAAPAAAVTESDDERIARIVAEQVAALTPKESEADKIARLVREQVTAAKQDLAESGAVVRKGLVAEHAGSRTGGGDGLPDNFPMKDGEIIPMEKWSEDQRRAAGAVLQTHVMGDRAVF